MTIYYNIVANPGSDNTQTFDVEQNGQSYDLDAEGVTKVTAYVCKCGLGVVSSAEGRIISSEDGDVTYAGDQIILMLGHLSLVKGDYDVQIKIFKPDAPNGIVILGDGHNTAIRLRYSC